MLHQGNVPTECMVCGAADFSSIVEVRVEQVAVMHWISPPTGWYVLHESRLPARVPLLRARCGACMASALTPFGACRAGARQR